MESEPLDDAEGPNEKKQSPAQRAWASFNSQGGVTKILIGSLTAALTATLSALLIALPGAVSGWLDQSADANTVSGANETIADAGGAPTTLASEESATNTVPPTTGGEVSVTTTEPSPVAVEIADVRMRVDDSFFYLDMILAPSSEPAIVNRVEIAATWSALPCTSGGPELVELGGVAAVQETAGGITTFRFQQTQPGVEGATPVEGANRGCLDPAFTRVALRPQLAIEPDTPVQFVAKIPRQVSLDDDWATSAQFTMLDAYGEPWGKELVVAVGTTADTCTWYVADLSDVDLPRLQPSPLDPLSIGVCPD